MVPLLILLAAGLGAGVAGAQSVEKLRLVSITSADLKGGIVAERKDGGRRWDISAVLLPEALRTPPR